LQEQQEGASKKVAELRQRFDADQKKHQESQVEYHRRKRELDEQTKTVAFETQDMKRKLKTIKHLSEQLQKNWDDAHKASPISPLSTKYIGSRLQCDVERAVTIPTPTGSRMSNSPISPMNERCKTEVGKARLMAETLKSYVRHVEHTQRPLLGVIREQLNGNEERKKEALRELEATIQSKRQQLQLIQDEKQKKMSERNDAQMNYDTVASQVNSIKTIQRNEEEVEKLRQLVAEKNSMWQDLVKENEKLEDYVTAQKGACCLRPKATKPPARSTTKPLEGGRPRALSGVTVGLASLPLPAAGSTTPTAGSIGATSGTPPQMKQPSKAEEKRGLKEAGPDFMRAGGGAVGSGSSGAVALQQQTGPIGPSCDVEANPQAEGIIPWSGATGHTQAFAPSASNTGGQARPLVEPDSGDVVALTGGIPQQSVSGPASSSSPPPQHTMLGESPAPACPSSSSTKKEKEWREKYAFQVCLIGEEKWPSSAPLCYVMDGNERRLAKSIKEGKQFAKEQGPTSDFYLVQEEKWWWCLYREGKKADAKEAMEPYRSRDAIAADRLEREKSRAGGMPSSASSPAEQLAIADSSQGAPHNVSATMLGKRVVDEADSNVPRVRLPPEALDRPEVNLRGVSYDV
jgi:hypothetical protein